MKKLIIIIIAVSILLLTVLVISADLITSITSISTSLMCDKIGILSKSYCPKNKISASIDTTDTNIEITKDEKGVLVVRAK